jgi:hypothetical protein
LLGVTLNLCFKITPPKKFLNCLMMDSSTFTCWRICHQR